MRPAGHPALPVSFCPASSASATPAPSHAFFFSVVVSRGRIQHVAVDQEGPDGLAGGRAVGGLDGVVHQGVVDQVGAAALLGVLVQAVGPALKDI